MNLITLLISIYAQNAEKSFLDLNYGPPTMGITHTTQLVMPMDHDPLTKLGLQDSFSLKVHPNISGSITVVGFTAATFGIKGIFGWFRPTVKWVTRGTGKDYSVLGSGFYFKTVAADIELQMIGSDHYSIPMTVKVMPFFTDKHAAIIGLSLDYDKIEDDSAVDGTIILASKHLLAPKVSVSPSLNVSVYDYSSQTKEHRLFKDIESTSVALDLVAEF